ncbi:MAG: DUF4373 domain-containing protein [Paludibacteraceae bacterium]|nr:DUF4373 domain-containing protein [Paludibacteraceae bacterium]
MKSVYYFPHDFNASQDQKLIKLQREMGGDGLAIYWKLIERLGPETDHKLPDEDETYVSLEWDFHFSADKIRQVVTNYGLFVMEDGSFYSNSLRERLRVMEESKERRARAGSLGGKAKAANKQNNSNATTEVEQSDSSRTQNCSKGERFEKEKNQKKEKEIKESKESKEIKENNIQQQQQRQQQQEKINQKAEVEEVEPEGGGHNWSEKVTDEEYLAIVGNMMRKLAVSPCDEADGLIDMMHPGWKGQYDDFFENKKDATGLWNVKRENKYANAPRANVAECRNIDAYVDIMRRARIYDKWVFNAYRGLRYDEDEKKLRLYVLNEKAAHYIEKYLGRLAPILRELYGAGVKLEYVVYSK